MPAVPAKVSQRLASALRRFQSVISSARARDVNESDTVVIVTDVLSEVFGFDKYSEVTSEHAIRGTFCDIVLKIEDKLKVIIEVKSVGTDFLAQHVKQAIDYAANQGVDWVVLTNAMVWQIYRVGFAKPITQELVAEFNMLELNYRTTVHLELLYLLSREGLMKAALEDHYLRRQATSRHLLGALLLTEPVLAVVRRELRRMSPDLKVSLEELQATISCEVLKRDVTEGEEAAAAVKRVQKTMAKATPLRSRKCASAPPDEGLALLADEPGNEDAEPDDAISGSGA